MANLDISEKRLPQDGRIYYQSDIENFDVRVSCIHSLGKFNETIGSYDLNGNIKSLTHTANGSASDNFTFTYTGNQLASLSGVTGSFT